jgi:hypothetical protein
MTLRSESGVMTLVSNRSAEARARLKGWRAQLAEELEHRPMRTLALAFGAGFLVAGGLFSRLALRMAAIGVRMAVVPLVTELLLEEASLHRVAKPGQSGDGLLNSKDEKKRKR